MPGQATQFEIDCTQFLNRNFGEQASFVHQGESDSTVSDILVTLNSSQEFYIEVKLSPAQSGQFVVLPSLENSCFVFSPLNMGSSNVYVEQIITHMNQHFEVYTNAGTGGEPIVFPDCEEIFSKWIINHYQSKNVKFVITNDFTIFPIESFAEYFAITATYRIKRSGSTDVGGRAQQVLNYLQQSNVPYVSYRTAGSKLFVISNDNLHGRRFILDGNEYMFSRRNTEYEIRKLSNTFNANVIFSVNLKQFQQEQDLTIFRNSLGRDYS